MNAAARGLSTRYSDALKPQDGLRLVLRLACSIGILLADAGMRGTWAQEPATRGEVVGAVLKAAVEPWLTISPGLSLRSPTVNMARKSDGQEASMTDPGSVGLVLNIKIQDFDFPGTRFGATLFLYSGYFTADRQFAGVDGGEVQTEDLGTSIAGYYTYLVPSLYYRIPGSAPDGKPMTVGLGAGKGRVSFKGDAIFGPDRQVGSSQPRTSLDVQSKESFAWVAFFNVDLSENWRLRVSVTTVRFSVDDYKGDMEEFMITLSRPIRFF